MKKIPTHTITIMASRTVIETTRVPFAIMFGLYGAAVGAETAGTMSRRLVPPSLPRLPINIRANRSLEEQQRLSDAASCVSAVTGAAVGAGTGMAAGFFMGAPITAAACVVAATRHLQKRNRM